MYQCLTGYLRPVLEAKRQVFEPSFDAKPVYTFDFLNQKIDYIHYNPVSGKWNLADDYTKYAHSSAAFYETVRQHKQVNVH